MTEKLMLTIPEAGQALGLSRSTIYTLLGTGDLPSVHVGRSRRITLDALRQFVRDRAEDTRSRPTLA